MDVPLEGELAVDARDIAPLIVINGQFRLTRGMVVVGGILHDYDRQDA
jgi:hypothetical protein